MAGPILLFILLCTLSYALIVLLNAEFEFALPVSIMLSVVIVFLFGVFNHLEIGFYVLLVLVVLSFFIAIYLALKKKSLRNTLKVFFSPSFFIFVFLFLFLIYGNYGRKLSYWDEFSHWGLVANQMTAFDVFGTNTITAVTHRSYPPSMAVFQYILQKLNQLANPCAAFSEWQLYLSYQLFCYSIFFPFIAQLNYKKLYSFVVLLACFILPLIPSFRIIDEIYIDPFLSVSAGVVLASIFCENKNGSISRLFILLLIFMLVLTKDVGLLFAIFAAIAYIFSDYYDEKTNAVQNPKLFLSIIAAVASVFLPKILWKTNMSINGTSAHWRINFILNDFIRVLSERNSPRWEVIRNYYNSLTNGSEISAFGVQLTYPVLFVILSCVLLAICVESKKTNPQKWQYYTMSLT